MQCLYHPFYNDRADLVGRQLRKTHKNAMKEAQKDAVFTRFGTGPSVFGETDLLYTFPPARGIVIRDQSDL
jgi:hypothetical protein